MTKELSATVATKISALTSVALTKRAAELGVTRGELLRHAIQERLGEDVPKLRPSAPATDAAELRQLLVELGRQGSLLNQLARSMNSIGPTASAQMALVAMESEYRRVLEAIRVALGVPA